MDNPFPNPPQPLPPPELKEIAPGITLLSPLSRKGSGPGILVVVDDATAGFRIDQGVPSPLMKWAEEGYTVVEIAQKAFTNTSSDPLTKAAAALDSAPKCDPKGNYGLVCYGPSLWDLVSSSSDLQQSAIAAVIYGDAAQPLPKVSIPTLVHLAGKVESYAKDGPTRKSYHYTSLGSYDFATPFSPKFNYSTEAVSHTRNLTFLKKHMNGPYFDLETIWDEHTYYEFGDRSVEKTMNTMVQEPYVNHIPTITGGIGRAALTDFYRNHFIFSNPEGTELELVSRTIGIDRVVDEFIFKLNHNQTVDWLLPGVPPTYVDLEIPMMAVVNIRGDRLYHEHITWDQATALRQVGILPEYMPWQPRTDPKAAKANGTNGVNGHVNGHGPMKIRVPVAGTETTAKMRDKNCVPSNEMFGFGVREV